MLQQFDNKIVDAIIGSTGDAMFRKLMEPLVLNFITDNLERSRWNVSFLVFLDLLEDAVSGCLIERLDLIDIKLLQP